VSARGVSDGPTLAEATIIMKLSRIADTLLITCLAACGTSGPGPDYVANTAPPGACGMVETHVIGIHGAPSGEVNIDLSRPGDHALVLSAYDATTWHVTLGDGARLVHVYAVGFHKQTVDFAANADGTTADLVSDSMDETGTYSCGYELAGTEECPTPSLFALTGARIHHDPTTFHGCYSATSWEIGENLATTSDCASYPNATQVEQQDWIGGCVSSSDNSGGCGGPSPI
jgi:hypothetical protein